MGKWLKYLVVCLVVMTATVPSRVWAQEEEPVARTGQAEVISAPPVESPEIANRGRVQPVEPVGPPFSVRFIGDDDELVRDACGEYRIKTGIPVTILLDDYSYEQERQRVPLVELEETSSYDKSVRARLTQEVSKRLHLDADADRQRVMIIKARISRGNDFVRTVEVHKPVIDIRIDTSYWSPKTFINLGQDICPEDATRINLIAKLVPKIMAELEKLAIEDAQAQAKAQAQIATAPPPSRGYEAPQPVSQGTELVLWEGSRFVSFPVHQGDIVKLMKNGKKVATIRCNQTNLEETQAWFMADQKTLALAMRPDITLQR